MASKGMIHFDAHPGNILVDAEGNIRFGDFGLATSRDFELSASEREFETVGVARHEVAEGQKSWVERVTEAAAAGKSR